MGTRWTRSDQLEAGSVGREAGSVDVSGDDSEEDAHPAISIAVAAIAIRPETPTPTRTARTTAMRFRVGVNRGFT
jgi:hypothetical protein